MSKPSIALRIRLGDESDFRAVVIRDRLPLLQEGDDRSYYLRLHRWLGDRIAEPVRRGETVDYYITNAEGHRLAQVECTPVARDELAAAPLKAQVDELFELLKKGPPGGPGAPADHELRRALLQSFERCLKSGSRASTGCCFFKFRDLHNKPRLVWCWGYERTDDAPSEPRICPKCRLLYLKSPQSPAGCPDPHCRRTPAIPASPRSPRRRGLVALAVGGMALVLAAMLSFKLLPKLLQRPGSEKQTQSASATSGLIVTPAKAVTLPIGGKQQFKVVARDEQGQERPVERQVVVHIDDPRVAQLAGAGAIRAVSPGATRATFYWGDLKASLNVVVSPTAAPEKLWIEPASVDVGVGAVAHLKLLGKYPDRTEPVDVTDAARWTASDPRRLYLYRGALEGLSPGDVQVRAELPSGKATQSATAEVAVREEEYQRLELKVQPEKLAVGETAAVEVHAVTRSDERRLVTGSSRLAMSVSPADSASLDGRQLRALKAGAATLRASFNDLEVEVETPIAAGEQATGDQAAGEQIADLFQVSPSPLSLVVGEAVELSVSPAGEGVETTSSDPAIVEVLSATRMVGRAAGDAVLTVTGPAGKTAEIRATVTPASFESITLAPNPIEALVESETQLAVLGMTQAADGAQSRQVTIAPDLLAWPQLPSVEYATFDPQRLSLRGIRPTDAATQTLAVRFGDLETSAPVRVTASPLRLETEPSGSVDLPLGQSLSLRAWATFGDGRRVEATASEVVWTPVPSEEERPAGVKIEGPRVWTSDPMGAPLTVRASYLGQTTAPLTIRPVPAQAEAVLLSLSGDRPAPLVGDRGQLKLLAVRGGEPIELGPGAGFVSSHPDVLRLDEATGAYEAVAPGTATITASHPAAANPAELKVLVASPEQVRLEFRPSAVDLAVHSIAEIDLVLIANGEQEFSFFGDGAPGAASASELSFHIPEPDAVRWRPPTITGLRPAEFSITADYRGQTAELKVRVQNHDLLAAGKQGKNENRKKQPGAGGAESGAGGNGGGKDEGGDESKRQQGEGQPQPAVASELKITPDRISLSPLEIVRPKVEQRLADDPQSWREVRPDAVQWSVPENVEWVAPSDAERPIAAPSAKASGALELVAEVGGKKAKLRIDVDASSPPPDFADPQLDLAVVRDPPGEQLAVGVSQRYSVVGRRGESTWIVPSQEVVWPAAFENAFLSWSPPTLSSRQAGKTQSLWAKVGDRRLGFSVTTVEAPRQSQTPPEPQPLAGAPAELKIVSGQTQPIAIPIGAAFDDFQVLARYGDGHQQDVTGRATLEVTGDGAVAVEGGRLLGLQPGSANVRARLGEVNSSESLALVVSQEAAFDRIELSPARISLAVGESAPLVARGFDGDRNVGIITGHAGLKWQARAGGEEAILVTGPLVTGVAPGTGAVTASWTHPDRNVVSSTAEVAVGPAGSPLAANGGRPGQDPQGADGRNRGGSGGGASGGGSGGGGSTPSPARATPVAPASRLVVSPSVLYLAPGETRQVGVDLRALRAGSDVTSRCQVVSGNEAVVRFDETTASLQAVRRGAAHVYFILGEERAALEMHVQGAPLAAGDGAPIVEPSQSVLSVGQTLPLRVFLTDSSGRRDRTTSAVFSSSNEEVAAVQANRVMAMAPGEATIAVAVAGTSQRGEARIRVVSDTLTDLTVAPARLALVVGETAHIEATASAGGVRRPLNGHPQLKMQVQGDQPEAIELVAATGEVRALSPGEAIVETTWGDLPAQRTVVSVSPSELARLEISPLSARVRPGETVRYQVFAVRSGKQQAVGERDGVRLQVARESLASVSGPMTIAARSPGVTEVIATLGGLQATAVLRIEDGAPAIAASGSASRPLTLRFDQDVLRLAPDGGPTRVAVFQIDSSGQEQDVSDLATLTADDPDGALTVPSRGSVITPVKAGQATLRASLGELSTPRTLLVDVRQRQETPSLRLAPSTLLLRKGETGSLDAAIEFSSGRAPLPVPYRLEVLTQGPVEVEDGVVLRALTPGKARIKATAVSPGSPYDGLQTTAEVEVFDREPAPPPALAQDATPIADDGVLTLSGPSTAVAGSEVGFAVNLTRQGRGWPVTHEGADLVVVTVEQPPGQDEELLARAVAPGVIQAMHPGLVHVQARYRGWVSNTISLRIASLAAEFERLTLEAPAGPLPVGASRAYRVWGVPAGGGAAQELTSLVGAAGSPLALSIGEQTGAVRHDPPLVTGVQVGRASLQAVHGQAKSNTLLVEVVEASPAEPSELRIVPSRFTLRPGDLTPRFVIEARAPGQSQFQIVDVPVRSENESLLSPVAGSPGRFEALASGDTRLTATLGGRKATALVSVVGGWFESVRRLPGRHRQQGDTFDVQIEVIGSPSGEPVEYRAIDAGGSQEGEWIASNEENGRLRAVLTSPRLPFKLDNLYQLVIEARGRESGRVERYPHWLSLGITEARGAGRTGEAGPSSPADDSNR